ncbi:MAG TPA: glycosyl hydrolase family 28-related protein [Bryobacteraceae bacterium]|nr:glycosyl hydrolase family 28-related protein [Bryobacteraceae bacterium]
MRKSLRTRYFGLALFLCAIPAVTNAAVFDVKAYGAKADGQTLDRDAINKAIQAASAAGGGTVYFSPGTYVTGSIRLASNITLQFEHGAILQAASDTAAYDAPEPNEWTKYQDAGHSHFHNSLIWGDGVENVSIVGAGLIKGDALSRGGIRGGDKVIALKMSRNITLRDFSILMGGHFGILATGVDNLTIDNIMIDTNRDGIDIDGCSNVRISNTSVNAPNDDAIVLKTTYATGSPRPTENVTITNCLVSGYAIGSLLDGTYKRTVTRAPDRDGPTGRIKIGTETDGDFKNITISNVVFDRSRGLALEAVDGGHIEDVAISNITMRDVSNAPIFIRLGSRQRAPEGAPLSAIRRVNISNVVAYDADPRYGSIITGIPGHNVEDVKLSNIRILYRGGMTLDQVAKEPADLVNSFFFRQSGGVPPREPYATPEREKEYPEPSMFGLIPAYGFFIRHATGVELSNVNVGFMQEDRRPAFVLDDVKGIDFDHVKAQKANGIPTFVLMNVENLAIDHSTPVPDTKIEKVERKEL